MACLPPSSGAAQAGSLAPRLSRLVSAVPYPPPPSAGVNAFSFWDKVRPKLEGDARWKLLPNNSTRRSVFEEFCKNVAAEAAAAKAASERAAVEGFKALLEEYAALERRVAAEMEATLAAAEAEAAEAREPGEAGEDGGGGSAVAVPRSPGSIPEEELDGLAYAQLERYWGADERWGAAPETLRRKLFEERFGRVLTAAAERREVRGARALGCGGRQIGSGTAWASVNARRLPPSLARAPWDPNRAWPWLPTTNFPLLSPARQAQREARVAAFRALLSSLGVGARSRWTPLAEDLARKPAGAALGSDEEREREFRRFVAEERVRGLPPGNAGGLRPP
jgi:hypothetical protein